MKKIIILALAAFTALLVSSCKGDTAPEFSYNLEVDGFVTNATLPIHSEFNAAVVSDTTLTVLNLAGAEVQSITAEAGKNASDWLNSYVSGMYLSKLGAGTKYSVHIEGFVSEKKSGLTFSVNKTFKN